MSARPAVDPPWPFGALKYDARAILDQENRIRVAIDDLVEFLNVMGAD